MAPSLADSSAPATAARVTREANLIARNLACHGEAAAAAETAEHIRRFWAPQLRSTLFEQARAHPERFSEISWEAITMLEGIGPREGARLRTIPNEAPRTQDLPSMPSSAGRAARALRTRAKGMPR